MRTLLRRRSEAPKLTDQHVRIVWQAASLLLDYPDDDLLRRLNLVHRGVAALPPVVAEPLRCTAAELASTSLPDLQAEYVESFDRRRQHALFLTYFTHGDTRRRGMALLRFAEAYAASGHELTTAELPDHLCVVLEYGATVDSAVGHRLLCDHRAGLEVLRHSLSGEGSRWLGALEAVCATLPPLAGDEREAMQRLIAAGPPEEEVGLTPYGTPGFDVGPAVPAPARPVDLPMPGRRRD